MDDHISAAALLTLADQLPFPMIVKRGRSDFSVRRAIYESLAFSFSLVMSTNGRRCGCPVIVAPFTHA